MRWSSLGSFSKLTVLAMLGMAPAYLAITASLEGGINAVALVPSLLLVLMAGLAATGNWLSTAIGALLAGFTGYVSGVMPLTGEFRNFEIWLFVVLAAVAVVTGLAAAWQVFRSEGNGLIPAAKT